MFAFAEMQKLQEKLGMRRGVNTMYLSIILFFIAVIPIGAFVARLMRIRRTIKAGELVYATVVETRTDLFSKYKKCYVVLNYEFNENAYYEVEHFIGHTNPKYAEGETIKIICCADNPEEIVLVDRIDSVLIKYALLSAGILLLAALYTWL